MMRSFIFPCVVDVSCSREVVLELMEGACHNPIGQVKSLLDSISMMDVDIYI
jgi:hypothetical protein